MTGIVYGVSLRQGMSLCGYLLLFILKIITTKIDNFIGTSLQDRRGKMANATSAIDKSIDNNDNDKKTAQDYFSLIAPEIMRL